MTKAINRASLTRLLAATALPPALVTAGAARVEGATVVVPITNGSAATTSESPAPAASLTGGAATLVPMAAAQLHGSGGSNESGGPPSISPGATAPPTSGFSNWAPLTVANTGVDNPVGGWTTPQFMTVTSPTQVCWGGLHNTGHLSRSSVDHGIASVEFWADNAGGDATPIVRNALANGSPPDTDTQNGGEAAFCVTVDPSKFSDGIHELRALATSEIVSGAYAQRASESLRTATFTATAPGVFTAYAHGFQNTSSVTPTTSTACLTSGTAYYFDVQDGTHFGLLPYRLAESGYVIRKPSATFSQGVSSFTVTYAVGATPAAGETITDTTSRLLIGTVQSFNGSNQTVTLNAPAANGALSTDTLRFGDMDMSLSGCGPSVVLGPTLGTPWGSQGQGAHAAGALPNQSLWINTNYRGTLTGSSLVVDGATGVDSSSCGTPGSPCLTTHQALVNIGTAHSDIGGSSICLNGGVAAMPKLYTLGNASEHYRPSATQWFTISACSGYAANTVVINSFGGKGVNTDRLHLMNLSVCGVVTGATCTDKQLLAGIVLNSGGITRSNNNPMLWLDGIQQYETNASIQTSPFVNLFTGGTWITNSSFTNDNIVPAYNIVLMSNSTINAAQGQWASPSILININWSHVGYGAQNQFVLDCHTTTPGGGGQSLCTGPGTTLRAGATTIPVVSIPWYIETNTKNFGQGAYASTYFYSARPFLVYIQGSLALSPASGEYLSTCNDPTGVALNCTHNASEPMTVTLASGSVARNSTDGRNLYAGYALAHPDTDFYKDVPFTNGYVDNVSTSAASPATDVGAYGIFTQVLNGFSAGVPGHYDIGIYNSTFNSSGTGRLAGMKIEDATGNIYIKSTWMNNIDFSLSYSVTSFVIDNTYCAGAIHYHNPPNRNDPLFGTAAVYNNPAGSKCW